MLFRSNIRVIFGNEYVDYDQVVLASHADQSLSMLEKPTEEEKNILEKFNYVKNEAYLHTDEKLMPQKKRLGLVGILFQMEIRHVSLIG